jgi:hypothetical protein
VDAKKVEAPEPERELPPDDGELLRNVAARFIVYVNPGFHKAVTQYAVSQSSFRNKVKPHDIMIGILEDWARATGINVPVRAKEPVEPKRRQ